MESNPRKIYLVPCGKKPVSVPLKGGEPGWAPLIAVILVLSISGCLVNMNNESLDDYADKVRLTMATLVTYIGKNKAEVRRDFGGPTGIKRASGVVYTHFEVEKVAYDEIWEYLYQRGIPGLNAARSTKVFYLNDGKVVSVEAY